MLRVMRIIKAISKFGLWFGGSLILLAATLIAVDVAMRILLNRSIGGADELAGYALAIGTVWALGAALLERGHIRIDSLYILFPVRLRLALDLFGLVLFVSFFGLVTWHGLGVLEQSLQSGSRSQSALETPLAIPQGLWIAGLVTFLATGTALFVHAIQLGLRGNTAGMAQAIGTRSAEEDVNEEIRDLEQRAVKQVDR